MGRIPLLPLCVLPSMPAIYESESYTATEMVAAAYGKMRELVADYNEFAENVNKEITNFHGATETEISNFKEHVEKRLCCKFKQMDEAAKGLWLDVKKYTDDTISRAFDMFGVTVKESGDNIILSDATNEKIRGLNIYGKTTQRWDPVPEYPSDLQSVGDSGEVAVTITNGALSQYIKIGTPEGLPGIPVSNGGNYVDQNGQAWICDEIDLARGVYIQRISKLNLTGEEKITRDDSWAAGCYKVYTLANNPRHKHKESMCSFLPTKSNTDLANNRAAFGIGTHGNECLMVRFGEDKTEDQTIALWQEAIKNGGQVYTILEEPEERPLTAAELAAFKELHTYQPDTTVTTNFGAGILLEYVCITQNYLENRLRDYSVNTATEIVNDAINNGKITVAVEYDPDTESVNIITGG